MNNLMEPLKNHIVEVTDDPGIPLNVKLLGTFDRSLVGKLSVGRAPII